MKTFLVLMMVSGFAHAASYEVPVTDPNLKGVATFQIPDPEVITQGDVTVMSYHLPPELVGENFPAVTLAGSYANGSKFELGSTQGHADCDSTDGKVTCNMLLRNIKADPKAVRDFILKTSKSDVEAKARMDVAAKFSGDPVGILKY